MASTIMAELGKNAVAGNSINEMGNAASPGAPAELRNALAPKGIAGNMPNEGGSVAGGMAPSGIEGPLYNEQVSGKKLVGGK